MLILLLLAFLYFICQSVYSFSERQQKTCKVYFQGWMAWGRLLHAAFHPSPKHEGGDVLCILASYKPQDPLVVVSFPSFLTHCFMGRSSSTGTAHSGLSSSWGAHEPAGHQSSPNPLKLITLQENTAW